MTFVLIQLSLVLLEILDFFLFFMLKSGSLKNS